MTVDRDWYERDLAERQRRHREAIQRTGVPDGWVPCAHDGCPSCVGTGVKIDGSPCWHMLACSCPRCSPR